MRCLVFDECAPASRERQIAIGAAADVQDPIVMEPMVTGAQHHQRPQLVPATLRARNEVMNVEIPRCATARDSTAVIVALHHFASPCRRNRMRWSLAEFIVNDGRVARCELELRGIDRHAPASADLCRRFAAAAGADVNHARRATSAVARFDCATTESLDELTVVEIGPHFVVQVLSRFAQQDIDRCRQLPLHDALEQVWIDVVVWGIAFLVSGNQTFDLP